MTEISSTLNPCEDFNNINIKDNEGQQFAQTDYENKTVYGYEKNKFKGFGEYNNNELLKENEKRINELVELTKQEYPTMDNYLIWICAVHYVMEELNIKVDNTSGKQLYEDSMKERNKTHYNSVELKEE
jgi:hypothetical protein